MKYVQIQDIRMMNKKKKQSLSSSYSSCFLDSEVGFPKKLAPGALGTWRPCLHQISFPSAILLLPAKIPVRV